MMAEELFCVGGLGYVKQRRWKGTEIFGLRQDSRNNDPSLMLLKTCKTCGYELRYIQVSKSPQRQQQLATRKRILKSERD